MDVAPWDFGVIICPALLCTKTPAATATLLNLKNGISPQKLLKKNPTVADLSPWLQKPLGVKKRNE
jgi:hypothetical protein